MTIPSSDNALDVLLEVRSATTPELDEQLLRRCYEIQKKYQFERDRDLSLEAMKRLIDDVIKEETSKITTKGGQ